VSLFNRLFKRDGTQEGEPSSAVAETHETTQLGSPASPADATMYIAAEADAAGAKSAQRAHEAAQPPPIPKPAPGGAIDAEGAHLPPRAAAEPQDSKLMSEKYTKPADATVKMPTGPGQAPEKPDAAAGKAAPRAPAPSPTTTRSTVMDPRTAAPRNANAALLKAAQAAADKRAGVKPGAEPAVARAPESPAAAPARPAGGVAVQPAPRSVGAAAAPPQSPVLAAPQSPALAAPQSPALAAPPHSPPASIPSLAESPAKPEAAPAKPVEPQPYLREQFDASAPRLLDGLLHLMLELRGSESAPADWARDAGASLRTLRGMAAKLDDAALLEALDGLLDLLERAQLENLPRIDGSLREELLRAYAVLRAHIPAAADPDYELGRRDPLLVEQILLQVNGVQLTTLRKLHAAGWTTSESFLRRTQDELARSTGMDAALAERIMAAFRTFRAQFATLVPAPARSEEMRLLAALLEELRMHQARFEQASARFGDDDLRERREQRVARARSVRGIYALLARLGELERIAALERAPFQAKISELTAFLSSAGRPASLLS
jgi:hypothetical protein